MLEKVKGGLIVSCQALKGEPLHSSFIMGKMAKAAEEGGAVGIRANSAVDINEIAKNTSLPIIGIVKKVYSDSPIYITPTMKEIDELAATPCAMIALDATDRVRHKQQDIKAFLAEIRSLLPERKLMADIATLDEAKRAEDLGFDCVSTTMIGYTEESKNQQIEANDFALMKAIINAVNIPIIAEGHIDTPEKAKRCLEIGAHAVVVGAAITRPQLITKAFTDKIASIT